MARFRFRLQPLLRARRIAEQEKQRVVADIERQRRDLEDQLRRKQEQIASGKQNLRNDLTGSIHAPSLRLQAHNSLNVMRDAQRLVLELAGVHRRLDSARQELQEATRQRRAIELLRDRRYEQWLREQDRIDAAMIDELAVQAAARKEDRP